MDATVFLPQGKAALLTPEMGRIKGGYITLDSRQPNYEGSRYSKVTYASNGEPRWRDDRPCFTFTARAAATKAAAAADNPSLR